MKKLLLTLSLVITSVAVFALGLGFSGGGIPTVPTIPGPGGSGGGGTYITYPLDLAHGGTIATNAVDARTNLGVYSTATVDLKIANIPVATDSMKIDASNASTPAICRTNLGVYSTATVDLADASITATIATLSSNRMKIDGSNASQPIFPSASIGTSTVALAGQVRTPGLLIGADGSITTVGTGTGSVVGNARGVGAVDLQTSRISSTRVVSGNYSFGAGLGHTVTGIEDVAFGNGNTVSGDDSGAVGKNHIVSGSYAFSVGLNNTVSGTGAIGLGLRSKADKYGQLSYASLEFAVVGDSQWSNLIAGRVATDSVATRLTCDKGADGATNRWTIASGSCWVGTAYVSAVASDTLRSTWGTQIHFMAKRLNNTVTVVNNSIENILDPTSTLLATSTARLVNDDANGAVYLEWVSGSASTNVRVTCHVDQVETVF